MDPENINLLEALRNQVSTLQYKEQMLGKNLRYMDQSSPNNSAIRTLVDESAYRVGVLEKLARQLKHHYKSVLLGGH